MQTPDVLGHCQIHNLAIQTILSHETLRVAWAIAQGHKKILLRKKSLREKMRNSLNWMKILTKNEDNQDAERSLGSGSRLN